MSIIRYENLDVEYETEIGDSILDADMDNGVDHTCDCGGNCACSTCKVTVISGAEVSLPTTRRRKRYAGCLWMESG